MDVSRIQSGLRNNNFVLLAAGSALLCYFTALLFSGGVFAQFLLYCVFLLLYVLMPGYGIIRIVFPELYRAGKSLVFSAAFVSGYAFIILCYLFLFAWFSSQILLRLLPPVIGLALCLVAGKYARTENAGSGNAVLLLFVFAVAVIISSFGMVFANPKMDLVGEFAYHQDFFVHIGNIASLGTGFPPKDYRFAGSIYRYHYADAVFHSVVKMVFNISIFEQVFYYQWIFNIGVLIVSLSAFAGSFLGKTFKPAVFAGLFLFSGCLSGFLSYENGYGEFLNVNLFHLLTNINATTVERIFNLTAFTLLIHTLKTRKGSRYGFLQYGLLTVLFLVGAVVKGPATSLFIGTAVVSCLLLFIRKETRPDFLVFTIVTLVGFFLLYYLVLRGGQGTLAFAPGSLVNGTAIGKVLRKMLGISAPLLIAILTTLLIPLHFFLFTPVFAASFFCRVFRKCKYFFSLPVTDYLVYGMAVSGILVSYSLKHLGKAQVYFLLASLPYIAVIGFPSVFRMLKSGSRLLRFLLILSVITSVSIAGYFVNTGLYGISEVRDGKAGKISEKKPSYYSNVLTQAEYLGLLWLRNNTTENAVFAANRIYQKKDEINHGGNFVFYSGFAERQVFLEGYYMSLISGTPVETVSKRLIINNEIFSPEYHGNRESVLRENNVKYVFVTKFLLPEYEDMFGGLVGLNVGFDNEDVRIYVLN